MFSILRTQLRGNIGKFVRAQRDKNCFQQADVRRQYKNCIYARYLVKKFTFMQKKSFYAYFCSEIAKLTSKDDILHFFLHTDKFQQFDIVILQPETKNMQNQRTDFILRFTYSRIILVNLLQYTTILGVTNPIFANFWPFYATSQPCICFIKFTYARA